MDDITRQLRESCFCECRGCELCRAADEIDRLRAELAACQQDAERYRWVLEQWDTGGPDFGKIMFSSTAETLSADIDTARKGEGE